jgi:hypothetical protein
LTEADVKFELVKFGYIFFIAEAANRKQTVNIATRGTM